MSAGASLHVGPALIVVGVDELVHRSYSVMSHLLGPALIMVGVFMAEGLGTIDWHDYMQADWLYDSYKSDLFANPLGSKFQPSNLKHNAARNARKYKCRTATMSAS